MARWLAGTIVENRHWTPVLFSLRVSGPPLDFLAGQFVRIALDIAGERIARPFSFVNAPGEPLEFYGVIVPDGPLSPHLARLQTGDALFYADNPSGFLVLAEVPPAEDLWMVATGTGIAPFLSILHTRAAWEKYRRVILVHAVRYAAELAYRDRIGAIERAQGATHFRYVTFVSREHHPGSLSGRIPLAVRDGRLEAAAAPIAADRSQLMLCGNPDMVKDVTAALAERGLRKHRRRAPGQITVENFW